jgi:hypothetical protein
MGFCNRKGTAKTGLNRFIRFGRLCCCEELWKKDADTGTPILGRDS